MAKARGVFARSGGKGPGHLKDLPNCVVSGAAEDPQWEEAADINRYLNHCEFVAVSIRSGALDEEMYKNGSRSQYVQAWFRYKEFV